MPFPQGIGCVELYLISDGTTRVVCHNQNLCYVFRVALGEKVALIP